MKSAPLFGLLGLKLKFLKGDSHQVGQRFSNVDLSETEIYFYFPRGF